MVIARNLSESDIHNIRDQFIAIDQKGDGCITPLEFWETMEQTGMDLSAISKAWDALDLHGSGTVNYTEFIAVSLDYSIHLQKKRLLSTFNFFDKNGDGKICKRDLKEVLTGQKSPLVNTTIWGNLIEEVDRKGDGEIDFDDFCGLMHVQRPTITN